MQAEFVLGRMIAQWEEADGKIVLSDDTGGGWSSGSGVLEFGFQMDSILLIVRFWTYV